MTLESLILLSLIMLAVVFVNCLLSGLTVRVTLKLIHERHRRDNCNVVKVTTRRTK